MDRKAISIKASPLPTTYLPLSVFLFYELKTCLGKCLRKKESMKEKAVTE